MDSKHILFLLDMFEGRLSIDDIMNMELPLLLNLEKEKAKQIEKEAKRVAAANRVAAEGGGKGGTIVNNGRKNR
jgi:hypothetical protein